ncbi:hypothetical protein [Bradyrhizobium australiense]|uniref:Uncharacterized protein n=1 Tax=Bradyrhizobium australiense TaxID=2721161 RepID=A0A7Y4GU17_9BRAD|nr:hypothetical protein [Bradyrhizobium australiense]NOJ41367.1 hypothetical protein [Bradyrhizobium australiense]
MTHKRMVSPPAFAIEGLGPAQVFDDLIHELVGSANCTSREPQRGHSCRFGS